MATMINSPANTYRIQFNKEFSLQSFEKITAYLQDLGVQTIYASPIFKAVPGSAHGYDITDPLQVNPEIGSLQQLKDTITRLKEKAISWLQDIVPNHMAFHHENEWIADVLEKGDRSGYASFFDIERNEQPGEQKLMAPFLAEAMETVLQQNQLTVTNQNKRLQLKYFDSFYPLNAAGYELVLSFNDGRVPGPARELANAFKKLENVKEPVAFNKEWRRLLYHFYQLTKEKVTNDYIEECLGHINCNSKYLNSIAERQFYRLCHWQETEKRINYRRFFLVNGLICLNMQNENVFKHYHGLIQTLVESGFFNGLRVDHIDGLYEPAGYLERLRELAGRRLYITVEKILEPGEKLPVQWQTQGTTGYDFLALINNLFTNQKKKQQFADFYKKLADEYLPVHDQIYEKKSFILNRFMRGELDNLYHLLLTTIDKKLLEPFYQEDLEPAIAEFLAHCPVYRLYGNKIPFDNEQAEVIKNIISSMRKENASNGEAINLLEKLFLEIPMDAEEDVKSRILRFYKRCMQFTGPIMAKGLEDTLMYTYNSFIAHNEVGDSPASFGISVNEFHKAMIERQKSWPLTLNATSTHDTKRGEDVRARLNVLSDLADDWLGIVCQWRRTNHNLIQDGIPAPAEEYFIYQSLVGACPMNASLKDEFAERFEAYVIKSLREAKINSGWAKPNHQYESACIGFCRRLLKTNSAFIKSFLDFHQRIVDFGIVNSLAQLLLKFTCPGIPDTYQGCETWDLSFVDPDNRRPVDFDHHRRLLNELNDPKNKDELIDKLWKDRHNGGIKLWLTQALLKLRKQQTEFFRNADYVPLSVEGDLSDFALAFARREGQKWLVTAIPLHLAELCRQQNAQDMFSVDWKETHVAFPGGLTYTGENILSDEKIKLKKRLPLKKLFGGLPLALVRLESVENPRQAGVLANARSGNLSRKNERHHRPI